MGIFSENPKSFKMDRKSSLASRLKSSISKKLLQFLGNYTDDVLAEYIIVLVCNGKHQIQARDDLEAFLGESSGEFVSWLWDHLLKHAIQSNSAIGVLDPKDVTGNSLSSGGVDRDLISNRPKEVQNHLIGNAESLLTRNGKHCRRSAHASSHVASCNMELSVGVQYCKGPISPLNEANANKVQSKGQRSTILKGIGATENIHEFHDDSLTQKPSRNGDSSLIPAGRDQRYECMDKSKKILNHNGNGLASQLLDFPKKEMVLRDLQPSVIEGSYTTQIDAANLSVRSPPRAVEEISYRSKKSRGSVWDRLGKPRDENCFANDKTVDANAVDIVDKVQEVYQQHTLPMPFHNEELCGRMKNKVRDFDRSSNGDIPGECRKLEQGVSMICKLNAASNIQRKRHFGEISSGSSSCLVSLVGQVNTDHQNEEKSQDLNRLNSTSQSATPALVSQVQVVKQRLLQIQMEMYKLRTKQLVTKKDGQPHVLSTSGVIKHSEDDVESRTVFVTNVHFAATKEALSLYFAKCGVVLSVVILSDKLNAQPKGSAYITFANKESVDKALALSGSSFFSRTLKVIRKAEEATVTSTPPQHAGKLARAQLFPSSRKTALDKSFYPSSHLQWRREPVSAPSEPSASINHDKGVGSAASHQLLSSSLASIGTTKTAAST